MEEYVVFWLVVQFGCSLFHTVEPPIGMKNILGVTALIDCVTLASDVPKMPPLAAEVPYVYDFLSRNTRQKTVLNVMIQNYHEYYWFSSMNIIKLK